MGQVRLAIGIPAQGYHAITHLACQTRGHGGGQVNTRSAYIDFNLRVIGIIAVYGEAISIAQQSGGREAHRHRIIVTRQHRERSWAGGKGSVGGRNIGDLEGAVHAVIIHDELQVLRAVNIG
ncbi:hypothetical protein ES703_04147 [subsurface metagenome]